MFRVELLIAIVVLLMFFIPTTAASFTIATELYNQSSWLVEYVLKG